MDINTQYDLEGRVHISVSGEVDSLEKSHILSEYILNIKQQETYITFLDANIIHSSVIKTLKNLQRSSKTKISVLKPYLYSYLCKLGMSSRYISGKYSSNNDGPDSGSLEKQQVTEFLNEVFDCYGYDYRGYQIESIMRRIKISMLRENFKSFEQFKDKVLRDGQLFEQLFIDLSVNTTAFFRDPEVFKVLRNIILPGLDSFSHLKIWCAGCSTGQEPYSMAILLEELGMLHKTQIYATDINPYAIEEAKNGLYSLDKISSNIENYRKSKGPHSFIDYFNLKEDYMEIDQRLKKNILFFQHSLGAKGILNQFQLIMCRNVMIYFGNELQEKVIENFYHSLDPWGFLVLGKSEGMINNGGYNLFYNYHKENKIFKPKV